MARAYKESILRAPRVRRNRQSIVTTPYQQSATTVAYTTNSLNQYTVVGGTSRTHDANGNLTDDGTNKYTYDYKNQIVEIRKRSDSSLIVEYKYDALGRRIEKNVTGTGVERYVLCTIDSANARGNLGNVMATYDGTGNWKQSFVHNGDVDDIVMLEQKDVLDFDGDANTTEITRSYYHQNALGSVMEITDAAEATVASYRYSPYGKRTITRNGQTQTSDPLGQHWGYTGRFNDEESGLWYYRARYYDPIKGRFLQRDPSGYSEGPGLYEYVGSNPTGFVDPSGLWAWALSFPVFTALVEAVVQTVAVVASAISAPVVIAVVAVVVVGVLLQQARSRGDEQGPPVPDSTPVPRPDPGPVPVSGTSATEAAAAAAANEEELAEAVKDAEEAVEDRLDQLEGLRHNQAQKRRRKCDKFGREVVPIDDISKSELDVDDALKALAAARNLYNAAKASAQRLAETSAAAAERVLGGG